MRSSFLFVRLLLVLASISLISLASGLTYPVGAPAGETTGGTYRTYFDNMFPGCSIVGDVIASFTSTGVPVCVTPAATGLNMFGMTGYTLYYNGSVWTGSANIYNNNGNVGIGMSTPTEKLNIGTGNLGINGATGSSQSIRFKSNYFNAITAYITNDYGNTYGGVLRMGVGREWGGTGPQNGSVMQTIDDITGYPNQNTHFSLNTTANTVNGNAVLYVGLGSTGANTRPSAIFENSVGIGMIPSTASGKLQVNGQIMITGGTPGVGKFLVSDASGIGSWQSTSATLSGTYWSLSGNTVGANDYIGSINAQDLVFKTSNIEKMRILSTMNASGQIMTLTGGDILLGDMRIGKGKSAIGFNTALGSFTLDSITTGNANTALGHCGLCSLTTGAYNTSVGGGVLTQITTGNHNTAVGYTSQNNNLTASFNTSIGGRSLNANQVGLNNSIFGYRAGNILTSSNNTLLGYQAGDALTTGSNNIALGANTNLPSATASNQLNIGNWIYGSGGNIGIGTSTPTVKLHVVGLGGGNVDIATAGSIQGVNINATNSFYFPNSNLLMYPTVSTGDSGNAYTFTDAGGSNLRQIKARSVWIGATQGGAQLAGINSSGGGYFSGNVGIGTSLPTSKLTISGGTIQIIDGTQGVGKILTSDASGVASWVAAVASSNSWLITGNGGTSPGTNFVGTTDAQDLVFRTNGGERARILSATSSTGALLYLSGGDAVINGITVGLGSGQISSNTANGAGALGSNTTGFNNTAQGAYSLQNNISGTNNTAIGFYTLQANTSGSNNTALGQGSLGLNDTGYENVSIGGNSLAINNSGFGNTANGYNVLVSNTTGSDNTANGKRSLWFNTVGSSNTTNGAFSLNRNTIGSGNVAMGYEALFTATGVSFQTAVGYQALGNSTTGTQNLGIGYRAGSGITTGSNNIAIGYNAQVPSGTASNQLNIGNWIYGSSGNIGIGTSTPGARLEVAGQVRITGGAPGLGKILISDATGLATWQTPMASLSGSFWSLLGNSGTVAGTNFLGTMDNIDLVFKRNNIEGMRLSGASGNLVTIGDATVNGLRVGRGGGNISTNTANGWGALAFNTTGDSNTANGMMALRTNTIGYNNTAIGKDSLYYNASGSDNTALGAYAANFNVTGNGNTTIGNEAGYGVFNNSYSNTTALGYQAGYRLSSSSNNNTLLGYSAGSFLGAGVDNVMIGSNAGASLMIGSGNILIGKNTTTSGIVSGNNQLNIGNWIYGDNGNIGIGTSSPSARLTVSGSALITSDLTVQGKVISDTFVNRTVNNVTISGSILPDLAAPLAYRDIGNNTTQSWNNLYLSGQVTIKGGTPGVNKVLTSDALGLATWQDVPASTNNWSTTGNTGTVAGTNFIGTTDNIDLVFKRNNIEGMRLSGASGNLVTTADATINDITVGRGGGNIASNTANGYGALAFNTTGTSNTANGLQALYFNATGINNTANGQRALFGNTTGNNNTANGYEALYVNTTASNNTANGFYALRSNATGLNNTANGQSALQSNTSGSFNTANGALALFSNTTGSSNTANGSQALYFNTTGFQNTANGHSALRANTTGDGNSANGYLALGLNTSGRNNSANGAYALYSNTTGIGNTANGQTALYRNTTGTNNTANGYVSLYNNTTGRFNVANGYQALTANTIGSSNVADGNNALQGNTTGSGNVGVGYFAGSNITTGNSNIAIGIDTLLPSATGSNQLNIGNWIYGSGGNIGIGISTPGQKLTVSGSIQITGGTPGDGKILTSDASGVASWQNTTTTLSGTYWSLSGNTVGVSDYIGSINTTDLVFKTNGIEKARILSTMNGSGQIITFTGGDLLIGDMRVGKGSGAVGFNTALGTFTLDSITTGNANTAIGHYGLGSLTSGSYNTSVGGGVLTQVTNGNYNTAIGFASQNQNLTASYNTSVGTQAIKFNTAGLNNSVFGHRAGYVLTSSNNVLLGYQVGDALTTGANNIVLGYDIDTPSSTSSNTLNIGNLIYGTSIDGANTTLSTGNIGIGVATPTSKFEVWNGATSYFHMRGTNNIGVGAGSVRSLLSGNANTGFGHESLYTLTSGYSNSAFGHQALRQSTSGFNNSAFGKEAMYNDNDGTWNTAIGYQALRVATSSDYNVAIGGQSLYNLGTGTGNIAIGHNALYGATSTASSNTAIGYMAGSGITSGWGNIAIGNGVQVPSNTASNQLNIGNWIYGSGGKISMGLTSISSGAYMLDVRGGYINSASGLCISNTCINTWSGLNSMVQSTGTPDYIAKFNSAGVIANSQIYETGGMLYIGDIPGIIAGAATVGNITIEALGSTNSSSPFLTLSENGGQECRMWITGANKMGSNCTWNAGIVGNYTPDRIMKADSTGIELTGSVLYEVAGNIGIGAAPTGSKLEVNGTFRLGTNGTSLNNILKATVTADVPSIAAGACAIHVFPVTSASPTGTAFISPASALTDHMIIAYVRVIGTSTVHAKFCNESGGAIDLASMDYYVSVIQ